MEFLENKYFLQIYNKIKEIRIIDSRRESFNLKCLWKNNVPFEPRRRD